MLVSYIFVDKAFTFRRKKCNRPCQACPFIMEGKELKSDKFIWKITQPIKCETENCFYMIEGNKEKCKGIIHKYV